MVPHTQCQKDAEDDATSTTRVTTATTTTNIKMEKMETGREKKIQKQGEDDGALSPYPFPDAPCPGVFRPCARASSRSSVLCSFSQNHILSLFFLYKTGPRSLKDLRRGVDTPGDSGNSPSMPPPWFNKHEYGKVGPFFRQHAM